jgi:DNA replication protein DnaC
MSLTKHYPLAARFATKSYPPKVGEPVMWVEGWDRHDVDPDEHKGDPIYRDAARLHDLEVQLEYCSRCAGLHECTFHKGEGSTLEPGWVQALRPVNSWYMDGNGDRVYKTALQTWGTACRHKKSDETQKAVDQGVLKSRLPDDLVGCSLDNYKTIVGVKGNEEAIQKVTEYVRNKMYLDGWWMFLTGVPGCGKSHILAAIINDAIASGYSATYATTDDIVGQGSDTNDHYGKEVWSLAAHSRLCGIDDFGHEKRSEWFDKRFDKLVDEIYVRPSGLIVTSNLNLVQFQGAITDRAKSRFNQKCIPVTFHCGDYRRVLKGTHNASDAV